jgi:hypothetical protein
MPLRVLREPSLQDPLLLKEYLMDAQKQENANPPKMVEAIWFVIFKETPQHINPTTSHIHQLFFPQ